MGYEAPMTAASGTAAAPVAGPIARFFSVIPGARAPQRAGRDAYGTLPIRAYRHCEAVTSAAAFGWHLFPPMDMEFVWDGGTTVNWTYDGAEGWYPLRVAQFPDFAAHFDAHAPADVQGFSPTFLAALTEPGVVQIWTGLVARTAPGWNLLLRPPANAPRDLGYEQYEGVVETDRWFGPIFTNIRLCRTGQPVRLQAGFPLIQAQPVQRATLTDAVLESMEVVEGLDAWGGAEWDAFRHTLVRPNTDPNRRPGAYAAESRRDRKRLDSPHGGD
ncbi:DUF6065 family protein [Roseomonas sp. CCTCC AB2023176]|uniref:DUF6065 family protein n=1 Tax=Roseomonas sp. CCTCC AB2023176 TaxID=3342640 RepID=UPI0035E0DE7A